jgi:anti-anti-sigma regulatory factor
MHHVSSRVQSGHTTIEVDGSLDAVAVYDLHRCLDSALLGPGQSVAIDLTRVTTMDYDGVQGLGRCCDAAVAAGVVLTINGCSRPALRSLEFFEALGARERRQRRA